MKFCEQRLSMSGCFAVPLHSYWVSFSESKNLMNSLRFFLTLSRKISRHVLSSDDRSVYITEQPFNLRHYDHTQDSEQGNENHSWQIFMNETRAENKLNWIYAWEKYNKNLSKTPWDFSWMIEIDWKHIKIFKIDCVVMSTMRSSNRTKEFFSQNKINQFYFISLIDTKLYNCGIFRG